jgi:hypothetical protein
VQIIPVSAEWCEGICRDVTVAPRGTQNIKGYNIECRIAYLFVLTVFTQCEELQYCIHGNNENENTVKAADQVIRSGIAGGAAGFVVCSTTPCPPPTGSTDKRAVHLPRQRWSLRRSIVSRSFFRPPILNIRNILVHPVPSWCG